jgi:hypothetical protein
MEKNELGETIEFDLPARFKKENFMSGKVLKLSDLIVELTKIYEKNGEFIVAIRDAYGNKWTSLKDYNISFTIFDSDQNDSSLNLERCIIIGN